MATTDMNAVVHIKDANGNVNNIFPATKIANVEGLQSALNSKANASDVTSGLAGKVDKETGKGLSTNDYTTTEKNKLAGIEAQANKTIISTSIPATPTNSTVPSMKLAEDRYAIKTKIIEFTDGDDISNDFIAAYTEAAEYDAIVLKGDGVAYIGAYMFGTPQANEPNKNDRPLFADKHISLIGLGNVTLKLRSNENTDMFVFCDCENWTFSGITFDYNLSNQSYDVDYSIWEGYSAIFLCFRCKDFKFERCKFLNSRSFEINYSKDGNGLILDRCNFTSADISLDTIAQKIQITDCTFAGISRAIYFEGLSEETTPGFGWNKFIKIENTKFSLKVVGLCDYLSINNCEISKIEVEVRDYKCFTITGSTVLNAIMGGNIKADNSKINFTAIYSRVNPTIISSSEVALNLTNNAFDKLIFNNCIISTDSERIMFTSHTRDQEIIFNCCDLNGKRVVVNNNAMQKLQFNGCYKTNNNNCVIYPRTLIPMVSVSDLPAASLETLYTLCIVNDGLDSQLYYCGYDSNTNPSWIPIAKATT